MTEALTLVPREPLETNVERIRRLEAEARQASLAEKDELFADLASLVARCADVSSLDSLPIGQREAIRGIGNGIEAGLQSAQAVAIRAAQ